MSGPGDERLDGELREVLRRRDPGAAPSALRTWVLEVPEDATRTGSSRPQRPLAALLGVAAVILLAVIGFSTVRHLGPTGVAGSSVASGSPATPSAVESPVAAFDPTLEGPGVSSTDDLSPAILVVLACTLLAGLALTLRGRRRFVPAAVAAGLAAWAVLGALLPITVFDSGYGLGLNIVRAPTVPGSGVELVYEVAPPNGRFSIGLYLAAEGPVPVRIEGIVSPAFGRDPKSFVGTVLTALWIDGEPNGGMTGPIRPFMPFDMPRNGQSVWLVGRAGGCALGSGFDPTNPSAESGFEIIESLDVRVSVLGWPRTVHVGLPFRIAEPRQALCSGPSPELSSSPLAHPSGQ